MCCERGDRDGCAEDSQGGFLKRLFRRFVRGTSAKATEWNGYVAFRISKPEGVPAKSALHVVTASKCCRITCTEGTAWVTSPDKPCDYILKEGESLVLQGDGKTIVSGGRANTSIRIWYN